MELPLQSRTIYEFILCKFFPVPLEGIIKQPTSLRLSHCFGGYSVDKYWQKSPTQLVWGLLPVSACLLGGLSQSRAYVY